jgi:MFS family permease
MPISSERLRVVIPLGAAQTIAWASSYYLPAILARPIAAELHVPEAYIFGALTGALIVAGLLGPRIGHLIDRVGGRELLCASNLVLAAGLVLLGLSQGLVGLAVAWIVLGVGMGAGLYEAAFATLTRLYGTSARSSITGITLIAGFASTVGWPLTTLLEAEFGWRTACFAWAGLHVAMALPLNFILPRFNGRDDAVEQLMEAAEQISKRDEARSMAVVAYFFAATGFVSSGMAALLPTMIVALGGTQAAGLFAGMLIGPSQVAARIVEASLLNKHHPVFSSKLAAMMHVAGTSLVAIGGPIFAAPFAILYGAGNGLITIARGALPLAIFGSVGFGRRVGIIAMPARIAGAVAPLILGLALERFGAHVLWLTCALSLSAFAVLTLLPVKR